MRMAAYSTYLLERITKQKKNRLDITPDPGGHRPQRPCAQGRTRAKLGSGAGKRSGAKSDTLCRRGNHAWTDDQAGRQKRSNIDAVGGLRVHTADDPKQERCDKIQTP